MESVVLSFCFFFFTWKNLATMLTTPQLAFLDLPARRACHVGHVGHIGHVAGAFLSGLFAGNLPTFQGPESASQ